MEARSAAEQRDLLLQCHLCTALTCNDIDPLRVAPSLWWCKLFVFCLVHLASFIEAGEVTWVVKAGCIMDWRSDTLNSCALQSTPTVAIGARFGKLDQGQPTRAFCFRAAMHLFHEQPNCPQGRAGSGSIVCIVHHSVAQVSSLTELELSSLSLWWMES